MNEKGSLCFYKVIGKGWGSMFYILRKRILFFLDFGLIFCIYYWRISRFLLKFIFDYYCMEGSSEGSDGVLS